MPESHRQALHRLAEAVGLAPIWQDVHGRERQVSDESLEALLDAMGLECGNGARIECTLRRVREEAATLEGRMLVVEAGEPIEFNYYGPATYRIDYESGEGGREGEVQALKDGMVRIAPVNVPGYHPLQVGKTRLTLAVTPNRCVAPPPGSHWGVAAQVYSLRRNGQGGEGVADEALQAGDYGALAVLAAQAGRHGAAAMAISPVHALFSADPMRYSPYAPSSRLFFNTAYLDVLALGEAPLREALAAMPEQERSAALYEHQAGPSDELIDWPRVQTARLAIARELLRHFDACGTTEARQSFENFRRVGGDALLNHCLYETLHRHYAQTLGPGCGWQDWPAPMRDPAGAAAQAFARQSGPELRFHAFMQWLADEGMRKAQLAGREAGMRVGLIADLAIGADARGSQAWCSPTSILQGATVGAAPDLYHKEGQDWGLTVFSPRALRQSGYEPFLAILRHAMSHAGGLRIDHVLGLARMWLVPQGASAVQGAFLAYPMQDLLGLIALESHRHGAIVVGENLGTVPPGFNELISSKGLLGTSVLWFEREKEPPQRFVPVAGWSADSMATTTTHDLPTVAGWWQGRDIEWRHRQGQIDGDAMESASVQRELDKRMLADVLPGRPRVQAQAPVSEVLEWVAASASSLCVFPLEDILAMPEQPNLPGPCVEGGHPNWLRRLPVDVGSLFDGVQAQKALHAIRQGRRRL